MKILKKEIDELVVVNPEDASSTNIEVTLAFPADFIGFSGHFPDNPVLPGICSVLTVVSIVERLICSTLILEKIIKAKFLSVIKPNDNIKFTIDCIDGFKNIGCIEVHADFYKSEQKAGHIEMVLRSNAEKM